MAFLRTCKRLDIKIIPVNPQITEALGEKAYPSLLEMPV
jgi:predicted CoA-binding protein